MEKVKKKIQKSNKNAQIKGVPISSGIMDKKERLRSSLYELIKEVSKKEGKISLKALRTYINASSQELREEFTNFLLYIRRSKGSHKKVKQAIERFKVPGKKHVKYLFSTTYRGKNLAITMTLPLTPSDQRGEKYDNEKMETFLFCVHVFQREINK